MHVCPSAARRTVDAFRPRSLRALLPPAPAGVARRRGRVALVWALAVALAGLAVAIRASALPRVATPEPVAPTTIVLVRHAEKGTDDARDPGLSEAGRARAEALADLFRAAGVDRLFASEFKRTQATLEPLAKLTGLAVEPRPARGVEALAQELRALPPGSVAVVAGHSNTVPALAAALGAGLPGLTDSPAGKVLDEGSYDRVFVLTRVDVPDVTPSLVELRCPTKR